MNERLQNVPGETTETDNIISIEGYLLQKAAPRTYTEKDFSRDSFISYGLKLAAPVLVIGGAIVVFGSFITSHIPANFEVISSGLDTMLFAPSVYYIGDRIGKKSKEKVTGDNFRLNNLFL